MTLWRTRLAVAGLVAAFAGIYSLEALLRHWSFGSGFDLAIYDQAVWHFSRLETPTSSIRGYVNIFGDHWHPVLMLLAPLYWILASASTLLVAQGCLLALSIVPVFLHLRGRLGDRNALLLSSAYGFFWGLQQAAAFDVHEFAFAPLFVATAILALDRRRWPLFWAMMVALGLTKEDLLPLVAWFGVYLWWHGERRRGAVLAAAGLMAFGAVVMVVIPRMGGMPGFGYSGAYAEAAQKPWAILAMLVSPPTKLYTAVMWLAPFAFLPLASPVSILLVPLVLVRFLSSSPLHWGTAFHYTAPLAPILAMAAGDGLARLARRLADPAARARLTTTASAACLLLAAVLPGHQRHWKLLSPVSYRTAPQATGSTRALLLVPRRASVVAQAAILPHVSQRELAYVLRPGAPDADIVIAATGLSPWPVANDAAIRALLDERRARGYRVLLAQDGWTVLGR
jgi:uncharacterized membrane protein